MKTPAGDALDRIASRLLDQLEPSDPGMEAPR